MTSPNLPPRICVESDNLRSLLDATRLPHLDTGRTRRALGRWVVLPRLDQFGPWPKRERRYAAIGPVK